MKPLLHAKASKSRYGGKVEDYLPIHELIDSSKHHVADMRHRALLHSSFGIELCKRVFGSYITNSEGRDISVGDIAEEHILEDMGRIPSVQDYFNHLQLAPWFGGPRRRTRRVAMNVD